MRGRYLITILGLITVIFMAAACAAPAAPGPAAAPTPAERAAPQTSATPGPAAKPAVQQIKMQVVSQGLPWTNFFLGREKGIFKEEGLEIEMVTMKSTLMVPALLSGEVEFGGVLEGGFNGGLKGLPLKVLMGTIDKPIWYLYGATGVNRIEDLKGGGLAVGAATTPSGYSMKIALKSAGLDPDKDVIFLSVDANLRVPALKAGSVKGAALTPPENLRADEAGLKKLLFTGDYMELPADGVVTTDKKLKDSLDLVKRMLRASVKSMNYLRDRPQESTDFIAKAQNLSAEQAKLAYSDLMKLMSVDGILSDKALQSLIEVGRVSGAISAGDVDYKKGLDQAPLKEVLKEIKR